MRVLLVNDWVAGEGGVESYLIGLREGLRAAGDDVRLLTSSAGSAAGGSAEYTAPGAHSPLAKAVLQIANPRAGARVGQIVREFRPEVAHVSMFEFHLSPSVLTALRSVPTILNVAYYKPICPTGLKLWPDGTLCAVPPGVVCWRPSGCLSAPHWLRDRVRYARIRAGLTHVDEIVTCSRWLAGALAREGLESTPLEWPVPSAGPDYRRARAAAPLYVYVGRLSREKGVRLLLRAFARLRERVPSAALRIVGDGPERRELEALGTGGVTFTGRVAPHQVEQHLGDAWALVAPSLWAEPFGLVAAEAIVRGVPVVASETGGFAETIEPGETGLLFRNGDEDALLACLESVAGGRFDVPLSPDAIQRLRERHDPRRHVERLRELFAELAAAGV